MRIHECAKLLARPGSLGLLPSVLLAMPFCTTTLAVADAAIAAPPALRVASAPVALPDGAGSEWAAKQPVLYSNIKVEDNSADRAIKFHDGVLRFARGQIESVLPRMNRFTVVSIASDGTKRLMDDLVDVGEAAPQEAREFPAADVLLEIQTILRIDDEKSSGRERDSLIRYEMAVNYKIVDPKTGVVISELPENSGSFTVKRTQEFTRIIKPGEGYKYVGGFNPENEESQRMVVGKLADEASVSLAALLARSFPVTTPVTGLDRRGTMFSIRKGSAGGVLTGTKVVVWAKDGDFTYVLAETTAEARTDASNLKVVRWNDGDEAAKDIIEEIKKDPKERGGYELFATTSGIPLREQLKPE